MILYYLLAIVLIISSIQNARAHTELPEITYQYITRLHMPRSIDQLGIGNHSNINRVACIDQDRREMGGRGQGEGRAPGGG